MTAALDHRFGPFDGGVWLNCAHQGPLPHPARDAALDAVAAKTAPAAMTDEAFTDVPARLRNALARLIGASDDDVLLANSTSYTLNVVAQGLSWRAGDEVVCVDGDFPATVLPWRTLEDKGVRVKLIGNGDGRIDADTVRGDRAAYASGLPELGVLVLRPRRRHRIDRARDSRARRVVCDQRLPGRRRTPAECRELGH
jgi:selenocysteine lyase/cysteine desulfurase